MCNSLLSYWKDDRKQQQNIQFFRFFNHHPSNYHKEIQKHKISCRNLSFELETVRWGRSSSNHVTRKGMTKSKREGWAVNSQHRHFNEIPRRSLLLIMRVSGINSRPVSLQKCNSVDEQTREETGVTRDIRPPCSRFDHQPTICFG